MVTKSDILKANRLLAYVRKNKSRALYLLNSYTCRDLKTICGLVSSNTGGSKKQIVERIVTKL